MKIGRQNLEMCQVFLVVTISCYFSDFKRDGPSLLLVLKWGGELTPAGRVQAEELGRAFRCMYPGGQGVCWTHTLAHYITDLFMI